MKKNVLIKVLFLSCVRAFTQNSLKQIIKGEKAGSKHFKNRKTRPAYTIFCMS